MNMFVCGVTLALVFHGKEETAKQFLQSLHSCILYASANHEKLAVLNCKLVLNRKWFLIFKRRNTEMWFIFDTKRKF